MKRRKFFWSGLFWANWIVIFFYWFQGSGSLFGEGTAGVLVALGRISGLAAAYMILIQFFLMGRMPWLERVYGLDRLSRVHQRNGKLGILFLIAHPILLVAGNSMFSGLSLWGQFLDFLFNYEHVALAAVGACLFIVMVATSLYIVRSRLRYESWYFVHLAAYLAVFSSFFHQREVGSDFLLSQVFSTYWLLLYAAVFGSHIVFRFMRPVYLFWRHSFAVARIQRESSTSVSVYISGDDLKNFSIRPGQFMICRFFAKGMWWQAHPFSLSMMPDGMELRITVRELGDFTRQIKNLSPGTKVLIDGPYGVFTDLFGLASKTLFIAGGIGITPVRSLMEEMLAKGKEAVLLYANKYANDVVFKQELEDLERKYPARIIHIISDQPDYPGEKGYVDGEKIARLVPDFSLRDVYICGPVPMMESVIKTLRGMGADASRIHYEKFSF